MVEALRSGHGRRPRDRAPLRAQGPHRTREETAWADLAQVGRLHALEEREEVSGCSGCLGRILCRANGPREAFLERGREGTDARGLGVLPTARLRRARPGQMLQALEERAAIEGALGERVVHTGLELVEAGVSAAIAGTELFVQTIEEAREASVETSRTLPAPLSLLGDRSQASAQVLEDPVHQAARFLPVDGSLGERVLEAPQRLGGLGRSSANPSSPTGTEPLGCLTESRLEALGELSHAPGIDTGALRSDRLRGCRGGASGGRGRGARARGLDGAGRHAGGGRAGLDLHGGRIDRIVRGPERTRPRVRRRPEPVPIDRLAAFPDREKEATSATQGTCFPLAAGPSILDHAPMEPLRLVDDLARSVDALSFEEPVACVYNPLVYARAPLAKYLKRMWRPRPKALLLGMNPGPFGMVQTGVPFGEVNLARDWLGVAAPVEAPAEQHPKRPILGFQSPRSEVSGARVWGWAQERFGTPEAFAERFFVWNWCPLAFLEDSGRNRTPDKLPAHERGPLQDACDASLREVVRALGPEQVIGVGRVAEGAALRALGEGAPPIGTILHPSPASPIANRGWAPQAEAQLERLGLL